MKIVRQTAHCLLALLLVAVSFMACANPFDPIDKSSEIRGLSYVDYALVWDRWDSDPAGDGVVISIEYFNEFGDSLSFHDKCHRVVIEFYTQRIEGGEVNPDTGEVTGGRPTFDELIFTFSVQHCNSDDDIRVPIEAYDDALEAAGFSLEESVALFVNVRVFPPEASPQVELVVFYADQTVYEPEPTAATEEDLEVPPEL